ncbi:hypothetical protein AtNW77_Chr4g0279591 [Arabidopsis thaliana]
MKLRSEMLELKLFWFLRPSRSRGNIFRCFKTRKDTIQPGFDRWRPAIRERFLLHAHHSSRTLNPSRYYLVQANSELNDMIEYYERLLLDREKEVMTWKDKSSSLGAIVFIQTKNVRTELESNTKGWPTIGMLS